MKLHPAFSPIHSVQISVNTNFFAFQTGQSVSDQSKLVLSGHYTRVLQVVCQFPGGGGTPILDHIRDVRPEWVSFPGRKPEDGCKFLTCGWVIILI